MVQAGRVGTADSGWEMEVLKDSDVSDNDDDNTEVVSVRRTFTLTPSLEPRTVSRFLGLGYPLNRCRN